MVIDSVLKKYGLTDRIDQTFDFEDKVINELGCREALGLGSSYSASRMDNLTGFYKEIVGLNQDELVSIVEDADQVFFKRLAAGNMLSLIGDPRIDTLNPEMVRIEAWTGSLGLNPDDLDRVVDEFKIHGVLREWILKETPEYNADIKAFKMAKNVVTNQEYLDFLVATNYEEIPTSWPFGQFVQQYANHPVQTLSEEACIAYAEWLSDTTGRKFRLPTEAEWELAAAGPNGYEYPWGNDFESDTCNTVESGILGTTPIGIFPKGKSYYGCLDMAGNIEEYVSDYYGPYKNGEFIADDLVVKNGPVRVARGGSFTRYRDLARCKRRHGRYKNDIYVMGFRLAEDE